MAGVMAQHHLPWGGVGCGGCLLRRGWPEGQRPGATPSGADDMMVHTGGARRPGIWYDGLPGWHEARRDKGCGWTPTTGQLGTHDGLQQCGCEGCVVAAVDARGQSTVMVAAVDARGQSTVMVVAVDAVVVRCVTQAPPPYYGAMGGD